MTVNLDFTIIYFFRFAATISKSFYFYLPVGTITFDYVLVDLGRNFDASLGEFVVPTKGRYIFMVDGTLGSGGNSATIDLVLNEGSIRQFSENNDSSYFHKSIIGIFSVQLNPGDVVKLRNENANTVHVNIHYPFRFMGVLIDEEDSPT